MLGRETVWGLRLGLGLANLEEEELVEDVRAELAGAAGGRQRTLPRERERRRCGNGRNERVSAGGGGGRSDQSAEGAAGTGNEGEHLRRKHQQQLSLTETSANKGPQMAVVNQPKSGVKMVNLFPQIAPSPCRRVRHRRPGQSRRVHSHQTQQWHQTVR